MLTTTRADEICEQNETLVKALQPKVLWGHFSTLCKIARGSEKELHITEHIVHLTDFITYRDEFHNVVVYMPATPGYEHLPSLCLQSHIDMVCVKNEGTEEQFPIELVLEGNKLSANGTTLGADNGIGVAAMMAIMTDTTIEHGPLELLFTTQEEIGLLGASAFDYSQIQSKRILNLDSEEEGILYVGCAGGARVGAVFNLNPVPAPSNVAKYDITLSEFTGGHSGVEIHHRRGNAIQILAQVLRALQEEAIPFELVHISGGTAMNAIAKNAKATLMAPVESIEMFCKKLSALISGIYKTYAKEKPHCRLNKLSVTNEEMVFPADLTDRLLQVLTQIPDGVIEMEATDSSLVRTSNTIGLLNTEDNAVKMTTMYRSSSVSDLAMLKNKIGTLLVEADATITISGEYNPWEPQFNTELLATVSKGAEAVFGNVQVKTMHAGLECAVFARQIPGVQIVSFGPTMAEVHTTKEWVDIDSVQRFWLLLSSLLK